VPLDLLRGLETGRPVSAAGYDGTALIAVADPSFARLGARFGVSDTICNERPPDQRRSVTLLA